MIHGMLYQCLGFYLVLLANLDSSCDYNECYHKYERDCKLALQNGNTQESKNAKSNYKNCLSNIEHDCSLLSDDVQVIEGLRADLHSCAELQDNVQTTTSSPAVPSQVKNIFASSACVVRGQACSRNKRSVNHHVQVINVTQIYPDWRDAIDRYSECLCDARKRSNSCVLEIPVFADPSLTSSTGLAVYKFVIFWDWEIKELQCLVLSSSEVQCYFRRRVRIYGTTRSAVLRFMEEKEEQSQASDGCGTFCSHYRCVFNAVQQHAKTVEDVFFQCLTEQCNDKGKTLFPDLTTESTHNETSATSMTRWTQVPTLRQPGTTRARGNHFSSTRQPGTTRDMGNRRTPYHSTTTSSTGVHGVIQPSKRSNTATIAGIIIGILVVAVASVLVGVWFWRRHRKNRNSEVKPRYDTTQACRQNSHTYMEISDPTYVNAPSEPVPSSVYYERAAPVPDLLTGTDSRASTDENIYQVLDNYSIAGSVSNQAHSTTSQQASTTASKGRGRRRSMTKSVGGQTTEYLELVIPNSTTEPIYDIAYNIYSKTEPDIDYYNIE